MDATEIRAAALLASATAHSGLDPPPETLTAYASQLVPYITGSTAPAVMILAIRGDPMPLTIDSVNAKAILMFADRDNDPVSPPAGTVATVTSSDTGVLTVGAGTPGTDTATGTAMIEFPLTEVSAGTSTLSVHAADAAGNPLLGPDGTTPIPDAAPVLVTVDPGAAAAERFTVPGA